MNNKKYQQRIKQKLNIFCTGKREQKLQTQRKMKTIK